MRKQPLSYGQGCFPRSSGLRDLVLSSLHFPHSSHSPQLRIRQTPKPGSLLRDLTTWPEHPSRSLGQRRTTAASPLEETASTCAVAPALRPIPFVSDRVTIFQRGQQATNQCLRTIRHWTRMSKAKYAESRPEPQIRPPRRRR